MSLFGYPIDTFSFGLALFTFVVLDWLADSIVVLIKFIIKYVKAKKG